MRVLVLARRGPQLASIAATLAKMSCTVDRAGDEQEARDQLATYSYDIAVWDLDLADAPAEEFLTLARKSNGNVRQLVLAGEGNVGRIADAVDAGAHEFIVKPVRVYELRLRMHALLAMRTDREAAVTEFGPLQYDAANGQVSLEGQVLNVTPRERSVLQLLLRHRDMVVSKDFIASRIFGMDDDAAPDAIEVYVHRLRRKMKSPLVTIQTVRGLGYRLCQPSVSASK